MTSPLDRFRVDGLVALVTGGASGIGRATAEVLAGAGAHVVVADRDGAGAAAVASAIGADGGAASAVELDIADGDAVARVVAGVARDHGHLDVLCNVAGVWAAAGDVVDVETAELDRVVGVNLRGTFLCCQAGAQVLAAGGSIVNVASSIIDLPVRGNAVYAMTKAAIVALTRVLADEVGHRGIRVNAIAPGPTDTSFTKHNVLDTEGRVDEEAWDGFTARMRSLSPLGEMGDALDQAMLVLYLVSPAGRRATGNVFRVNAGVARPG
jgi:3-oxoacyl-[acyl-carrier protein] reductase